MRRTLAILLTVCLVAGTASPAVGAPGPDAMEPQSVETTPAVATETQPQTDGTAENATTETGTANVTILSYNDIQTAAAEDKNFPRLVTAIQQRRAANGNETVVVGAGDEVGPHALSPISQWRAPVDVLNTVDPTADVIGNHEFDYGYESVSNITDRSTFPWLATNIVNATTGEPFQGTDEYTIVERNGVRIGVIGLIDREAAEGKTNIDFSEKGAKVENYTVDGPATARMLKENRSVDVVVALAHVGVPDARTLAETDGNDYIDVIAVGDDELEYPPQAEDDGTIITEAKARAEFLSELTIQVDTGADDVVGFEGRLIEINDTFEKDATASEIITEYRAEVSLDSPVGNTTTPLDARFSTSYHVESAYGNLITDAMRAETNATVAVTNAGGIRSDTVYAQNATDDNPVPVTGGDVFNTLPFPNTLVTFELNGSQLREVLASQVVTLESETGQEFGQEISQQVSGVRFEWVGHNGSEPAIRDVYVNTAGPTETPDWERLRDNGTYNVTVNSFMAEGGSGYPLPGNKTVVSRTDKLLAITVIEYLQRQGTVDPEVEGRIQRVDRDLADATVRLDGNGKVVLTYDRPTDLVQLRNDTVAITAKAPGSGSVTAEQVVTNPDRLVVRFDDGALAELVNVTDSDGLDLYAQYNSSEYDPKRVYFDDSRLNGDITVELETDGEDGREKGRENGRETDS